MGAVAVVSPTLAPSEVTPAFVSRLPGNAQGVADCRPARPTVAGGEHGSIEVAGCALQRI